MGAKTSITWTTSTWGIARGCDDASRGCLNCYAKTIAARFSGPGLPYEGLAKFTGTPKRRIAKWSGGGARFVPEALSIPLRWRKPRRVFVASTSDLFHESLTNEEIAAVFGVMAAAPQHIFQVLTKRPERMREWFAWHREMTELDGEAWIPIMREAICCLPEDLGERLCEEGGARHGVPELEQWPLPNVHLGVSIEDQTTADERIPILLDVPAAVRFLSCEPLLGPVDLSGWGEHAPSPNVSSAPERWADFHWPDWVPANQRDLVEKFWAEGYGRGPRAWLRDHVAQRVPATGARVTCAVKNGWADVTKMAHAGVTGRYIHRWNNIGAVVTDHGQVIHASGGIGSGWLSRWLKGGTYQHKLGWVIVGGEAGPGARPFHLEWAADLIDQCRKAEVAAFCKQAGSNAFAAGARFITKHRKGEDPSEWPEELRVRQFPEATR